MNILNANSLKDKVAIITGAAQGIGAGIASRFIKSQAKVVLVDKIEIKQPSDQAASDEAISLVADITKKADIDKVVKAVRDRFGRIDILVNNAGVIRDGFLSKITEDDWDTVLDVNLKGAFLFCQAVFPAMKEQKDGRIINITSRSWLGNIGQANYSASKGGLVSLTRTLALELARYQIRVNAVAPGLIDTPMTRGLSQEVRDRLIKMQPTGRMGTPDDIAAAVEFLASDNSAFITGQVLHVDGGKSCGLLYS